jgi:hypothetical protein
MTAWGSAAFAEAVKTLKEIRERGTVRDIDSAVENLDKLICEIRELVAIFKIAGINITPGAPETETQTEGDKT